MLESVQQPKRGSRYRHGYSKTRIYNIYCCMIGRCCNENDPAYKYYGNRKITVCKEWKDDFVNFLNWAMENGYTDELTIDRVDVNGNYEPSNCRWVNNLVQQNNKTNNNYLTHNGETHTLAEWSRITGIDQSVLWYRQSVGYTSDKILNPQIMTSKDAMDIVLTKEYGKECINRTLEIDGEIKTYREWSKISGVSVKNITRRINELGWSPKDAVFKPTPRRNRTCDDLITIQNETHTLQEWKKLKGLSHGTYNTRIKNGWSIEDAIMTPIDKRFNAIKVNNIIKECN